MLPFKEEKHIQQPLKEKNCLLAVDIGGTNSNFGVFSLADTKTLLYVLHVKSHGVEDFTSFIKDVVSYMQTTYEVTFTSICIGAAGVISEFRDFAKPTNLTITIDAKKIQAATGISKVILINDFEAVGYGIEWIDKKNVVQINQGSPRAYANKALLGAGTGLGKGIMGWDEQLRGYMPIPSEGGHADCAVQTQHELDLITFMRKEYHLQCNVSWEHILSGAGIQRIYTFLGQSKVYDSTKYTKQITANQKNPDEIFAERKKDSRCEDTFKLFSTFYGRCAKNFALDALSLGGMYIAGGIAAHNIELFQIPEFMDEFLNCGKQRDLLKQVPLYVITDYNVSLYGASRYLVLEHMVG